MCQQSLALKAKMLIWQIKHQGLIEMGTVKSHKNKTGKLQGADKQDDTSGASSPDKTGEKPSIDYIIGEPDVDTQAGRIRRLKKTTIQATIDNF